MSYKDSELGKIPQSWEVKKLIDISRVQNGYAFKSKNFSNKGNPVIKIKNVNGRFVDKSDCQLYPIEMCESLERFKIDNNDVLIAMTGAGSVGRVSKFVNNSKKEYYLNQRVGKIIPKLDELDNEYLYQIISTPKYQGILYDLANGSGQPNLSPDTIGLVKIPCPPIDEQKAIAKILSDLDEKIGVNNKINKKLEEMAQAIFKQWFVDFEFPNEYGKPYKSSGGEMVESELGIIPKYWKNKELKEVIKFTKGKKPKIITDKEFDNSKLYLTIDVLNRNSIQYAINDKVILANKNDILMVMDGASSGSLYYGLDGIVGSTLSKVVINDEYINEDILYYFLKLNEINIKGNLTGSAIPHTDKEYVNRLIMCIPNDKELLVRATKILSDIREKVIINNEENSRLIKLRDTLLPKLMSGEIRVPID